jgi:hypothetical protein
MPEHYKVKLRLLAIFYKSTLTLSICFSVMISVFGLAGSLALIPRMFGFSLMTGGTLVSLLYKEITLKHEYYFYYNQAISKTTLIASCVLINFLIGSLLIIISAYV